MGKVQTFKYKTNIDCIACIEKVRAILDMEESIQYWYLDPVNENHILTVTGEDLPVDRIIGAVKNAGFEMTRV